VTGIRLYVEGGGDSVAQRREMRTGFDCLLAPQKNAARQKRLRWDTIFHGGRQETFEAFVHALQADDDDTLIILLVDAEDAIGPEGNNADANAQDRLDHLTNRDGWDFAGTDPKRIHLMVRCMEAWIVADPEAVTGYYGKNFHARSLPNRQNLEDEPKADLLAKLHKATEKTRKGAYAKIKHASKLLEVIDRTKIANRCRRFRTFTAWLTQEIART
jgi:hypothetical protein